MDNSCPLEGDVRWMYVGGKLGKAVYRSLWESIKGMETWIETNSKAGHKSHNPTNLVLSLTFPTIQARLTGPLPPPLKSSSEGSKNKVLEQNQIGGDHCGRGGGGESGGGVSWRHRKHRQRLRQACSVVWCLPSLQQWAHIIRGCKACSNSFTLLFCFLCQRSTETCRPPFRRSRA